MKNDFRKISPKRSYDGPELKPYRKYKEFLRTDFNKRCGYSDCPEIWFGGKSNFHIDHFLPKSKHPQLECQYSNLIYSCSFINIAKSDDEGQYLDPCEIDYNDHFERDELGNIIPKTESEQAEYMIRKLKMYLKRYGIIWMLENLRDKISQIDKVIKRTIESESRHNLLQLSHELSIEFQKYLAYLEIDMDLD